MKILHVGYVGDLPQSGVSNIVPKHLEYQSKHAEVALLNIASFIPANAKGNYKVYNYDGRGLSIVDKYFSNPDLIIFHEVYRFKFIKLAKEAAKRGIHYIVIPHGSLTKMAQAESSFKKHAGNLLYFNRFIKNSYSIQYLTDKEREVSIFIDHPHIIQGNGLDIIGRKKHSFSKKGLSLIYVGRLDVNVKGLDILLEAIDYSRDSMREANVRITIAGPDSKGGVARLNQMIDGFDIGDIVKVEGPVYGQAKISKILNHDMFIQLSRTEGQPLSIVEALDLGMPCIVTPGTTFYDAAVNKGVALGVEGTPEAVATKIMYIANNKHILDDLSLRASTYANSEYDWQKVGRLTIDTYRDILERR